MARNKSKAAAAAAAAAAASSSSCTAAVSITAAAEPHEAALEIKAIEPFPRFDVVSDDSDHFYLDKSQKNRLPVLTQKKIMQEWKLLKEHLPESITVRAYEKRLGLLRAAIVGVPATPYHDGLFFFDIFFPPNYPAHPPQVRYQSFWYRINPNLYWNGEICLSLLNTWSGKKSERWKPDKSTILQVLLSIQALVLNERPYYNEPGYGSFKPGSSGEKKSFAYNENTFILSCKSMVQLINKPPKGFEDFVGRHFRDRAPAILRACEAYANGRVRVGYFPDSAPQGASKVVVSEKFKADMKSMYPALFNAFGKEGASLDGLSKQLRLDQTPCQENKKKGLVANVVTAVKKPFAFVSVFCLIFGNRGSAMGPPVFGKHKENQIQGKQT